MIVTYIIQLVLPYVENIVYHVLLMIRNFIPTQALKLIISATYVLMIMHGAALIMVIFIVLLPSSH